MLHAVLFSPLVLYVPALRSPLTQNKRMRAHPPLVADEEWFSYRRFINSYENILVVALFH